MAKKYLDDEGLRYLWTKIKNKYATQEGLDGKVDKETGKALSSNDFTDTLKSKLEGIAVGAEVNVQSNWSETDSKSDAFIKNKPSIPTASTTTPKMDGTAAVGSETKWAKGDHVHPSDTTKVDKVEGKGLSTNDFTNALKTKLEGVEAGAEVNVLEGVQVNGTDLSITDKKVNIPVANGATYGTVTLNSEINQEFGAEDGKAATPKAVKDALERAKSYTDFSNSILVDGNSCLITSRSLITAQGVSGVLMLYDDGSVDGAPIFLPDSNGVLTALNTKVDKVDGKGLSTNDFTDAEKTKLAGIAAGAEVNVLEGVQVDGTDLTITDKKVNVPIFTGATTTEDGAVGLVPQPSKKGNTADLRWSVLSSDGQWNSISFLPVIDSTGVGVRLGMGSSSTSVYISTATTQYDGVMSSTDKTKLDKLVFDGSDKIDSSILPSYVDDVVEAYARSGQTALSSTWLATGSATGTVITPEAGVIYILMADSGDYAANTQFRWAGTTYVKLADGGVSSITNAEIDTIVAS